MSNKENAGGETDQVDIAPKSDFIMTVAVDHPKRTTLSNFLRGLQVLVLASLQICR